MLLINSRGRRLLFACAAMGTLCGSAPLALAAPAAVAAAETQTYDLKAQDLESALQAVALRSGRAIIAPSRLLAGKQAPALKGDYTASAAFGALLAGSGLELVQVGDTLVVREPRDRRDPAASASELSGGSTVAEVTVTGSRIRGAPLAGPIDIITRTDIQQSGYSSVGDLIRSLPEDYGGGPNPGVLPGAGATSAASQNLDNASSVNLRGLGSDATLVLIDGQRLSADGQYQAADVSVIPLAAISRIDVVTDGSSALYGADAVAGVVNFVLRKDYNGAELSETLGDTTQGGGFNQLYSALAGGTWGSGHALAAIEYNHQDSILTGQRDFTSATSPVNALLQAQNRISVFANAGQDLSSWAAFNIDVLGSQRDTGHQFQDGLAAPLYTYVENVKSYFVAPSLTFTLPGSWSAVLSGSASGSRNTLNLIDAFGGYRSAASNTSDSVELSANGDALSLPTGTVKLALGGGYLWEGFGYTQSTAAPETASRGVGYLFGEADVPLILSDNNRVGLNALDLTLAGRIERYSDFGVTSNPKVGLRYQPTPGLAFRATWGTSFKAPQFDQEILPNDTYLFPAALLGGGAGTALFAYGGNTHLKPERSRSWTAGLDWSPPQVRALTVSLTYFNIDYTDRIILPFTTPVGALSNAVYAPFIVTNPTPAQQAATIVSAPALINETGQPYDPSNVVALLEGHYINASAQKIDGVDLSIKEGFVLPLGSLDTFAGASWLHIQQQLVANAPTQTVTGTLFNAPSTRVRSGLTWVYGGFSSTGVLNWVAGETDNGVSPNVPISAWTTVDLVATYKFRRLTPQLAGLEGSLAITNAFDRPPPFAKGAGAEYPGFYFDSTNASAVGRFISLTLRQRF